MNTQPICPCDTAPVPLTNLPALPQIHFRAGDFNSFRRALLTPLLAPPGQPPLEQSLSTWQPGVNADPAIADLGVMMIEWWAYLADILTFYNERIANEDYLRTAILPETPAALIQILGYRPRPAIAATGVLAALPTPSVLPGQSVTLPAGLQFQSKPGPGAAPQTFELSAQTLITQPGVVRATPPPTLIATITSSSTPSSLHHRATTFVHHYQLLLQGTVTALTAGTPLLLGPREDAATPILITLFAAPAPSGSKQTTLTFTSSTAPPGMNAANARLLKSNQSLPLWTVNAGAIDTSATQIHLASLARPIRPNDFVVFTSPTSTQLVQIAATQDVFGDASASGNPNAPSSGETTPIPVLHTRLTLSTPLNATLRTHPNSITVLFGWVEAGILLDQPSTPWSGTPNTLVPTSPATFPPVPSQPILLQDAQGTGAPATAALASANSLVVTLPTPLPAPLQSPLSVFYNLLPVTAGKTVPKEILGSGDASIPGQTFKLAKSPVTYLATGPTYASTITLMVNNQRWTEVPSFYDQPPNAQVFITREDSAQNTWVSFGDGVNGARIPTGSNNVTATYRTGGGAASPPAGALTVISQSLPGLQTILNPVPVSGGSDPDPAALLQQYAPRSVLTFGRAVSVFDFEALAAQAPGVTRASAIWTWDAPTQRAGVTVYVAGEPNIVPSVQTLLTASGDPNRPILVQPATKKSVTLTLTLVLNPAYDAPTLVTAVTSALSTLFGPQNLRIGQPLFDSNLEASCLAIPGVIAIRSSQFLVSGSPSPGPLHIPGEGAFFSLDPANLTITTQEAAQ